VLQLYVTLPGGLGLTGWAAELVRWGTTALMLVIAWPGLRLRWAQRRKRWTLLAPLLPIGLIAAIHLGAPLWAGAAVPAVALAAGCALALRSARGQWARGGRLSKAKTLGLVYVAVALVVIAVSSLRSALKSGDDGPKTVFITGLNRSIDPRQTIRDTCPDVIDVLTIDLDEDLDRAHGTIQYWVVRTPTQRFKDAALNLQTGVVACP
jgi:hypothetical protein